MVKLYVPKFLQVFSRTKSLFFAAEQKILSINKEKEGLVAKFELALRHKKIETL